MSFLFFEMTGRLLGVWTQSRLNLLAHIGPKERCYWYLDMSIFRSDYTILLRVAKHHLAICKCVPNRWPRRRSRRPQKKKKNIIIIINIIIFKKGKKEEERRNGNISLLTRRRVVNLRRWCMGPWSRREKRKKEKNRDSRSWISPTRSVDSKVARSVVVFFCRSAFLFHFPFHLHPKMKLQHHQVTRDLIISQ